MIYLYSVFSLLLGLYSLPLMIDVIKSKHDISHLSTINKFLYFLSCFLFLTFPFVNFAAFLEGILLQSSFSSYVSGIYGIIFICFYFIDLEEKKHNNTNEFDLNSFFEITLKIRDRVYPAILCKDGFSMSVQANENAYCTPRQNNAPKYEEVEVGFPSQSESLLQQYKESPEAPDEKSVYPYVPVEVVEKIVMKHGGVALLMNKLCHKSN